MIQMYRKTDFRTGVTCTNTKSSLTLRIENAHHLAEEISKLSVMDNMSYTKRYFYKTNIHLMDTFQDLSVILNVCQFGGMAEIKIFACKIHVL